MQAISALMDVGEAHSFQRFSDRRRCNPFCAPSSVQGVQLLSPAHVARESSWVLCLLSENLGINNMLNGGDDLEYSPETSMGSECSSLGFVWGQQTGSNHPSHLLFHQLPICFWVLFLTFKDWNTRAPPIWVCLRTSCCFCLFLPLAKAESFQLWHHSMENPPHVGGYLVCEPQESSISVACCLFICYYNTCITL